MIERWRQGLAWSIVALLAVRFGLFAARAAGTPSHGYAAYYTAARLLLEGQPASRFYDDAWFRAQVERLAPGASDIYNVNPPTTALLLVPLAGLDHATARLLWTAGSGLLLVLGGLAVIRSTALPAVWQPVYWIIVLVYQPLWANFAYGQAYVLVFCLLAAAWLAYGRRRLAVAGGALGAALVLKTAAAVVWVLPAARRQWRLLAAGGAVVAVIVVLSLPWLGVDAWREYAARLPGFAGRPELSVTAYQTTLGFFRHLLIYDERWNPAPLAAAAGLALMLPALAGVAMIGISAWAAHSGGDEALVFAAVVTASVTLSPVSLDYHYTVLLVPLGLVMAWAARRPAGGRWIVLAAALFVLAADLPFSHPRLSQGAWALLAYPKLYGAWLLWGLAVWGAMRERGQTGDARPVAAAAVHAPAA